MSPILALPVQTGRETILLVEDELALLELAQSMLLELGYTVLAAEGPRPALELAAAHPGPIHLLLTDVVMPDMSGRDLWRRLSADFPDLKCLYMSGYTTNVISHHGVLEQGVHFLPKPFTLPVLALALRGALAEIQARHWFATRVQYAFVAVGQGQPVSGGYYLGGSCSTPATLGPPGPQPPGLLPK